MNLFDKLKYHGNCQIVGCNKKATVFYGKVIGGQNSSLKKWFINNFGGLDMKLCTEHEKQWFDESKKTFGGSRKDLI